MSPGQRWSTGEDHTMNKDATITAAAGIIPSAGEARLNLNEAGIRKRTEVQGRFGAAGTGGRFLGTVPACRV